MDKPVSVIILAAGLGTRMRSKRAKVLHRAGGMCLLEHVLEAALEVAPAERIVAVVGHQAEEVRAAVAGRGIRFQLQTEQLGTGHAVRVCAGLEGLDEGRVVVVYGDCPLLAGASLKALVAAHERHGAAATVVTTHLDEPTGYGRILRDAAGYVIGIVEEKAASAEQKRLREINSGIYAFEAPSLWPGLKKLRPNPASGEIYLTDIVETIEGRVAAFPIEDPREIMGINTRVELAQVDRIMRERKARELMLAGVTIEKPESVTIDTKVRVGQDTVIAPFAQLLGATVVGENCQIGACSILRDATLEEDVIVHAFTSVESSHLEAGAHAGPYARLRMNARLEAQAHVGNFVELKNTRLGRGSKSMHLAYLGDSTIGKKTNIGAGTITCNFDGVTKSRTAIGDGAFVGSNATLVAPVEIGAGSYVAAGSVITDAVPEDALALGRSRQINKPEWAKKRREKRGK